MSISLLIRQIDRLEKEIVKLQQEASSEAKKEAQIQERIQRINTSITRNTSASQIQSKARQIERLNGDLTNISRKKSNISKKIADKSNKLANKRRDLQRSELKYQNEQLKKQQSRDIQLEREITQLYSKTTELNSRISIELNPNTILQNVFVMESETSMLQGTCFNLSEIGLVTCAHVLAPDLYVFHPSDTSKKFFVEVQRNNLDIDIAIISAEGLRLRDGLIMGTADEVEVMTNVFIAGYPNFRIGDSGIVSISSVSGFRVISGIRRLLLNTPIIAGTSGGPVFDRFGKVIGIAVTGADSMENAGGTENHGIIPIDSLNYL